MNKVKLGEIVERIKEFVNKDNTDLIYYVGGEHFENERLRVRNKGIISGSTIGPAFSTKFKPGDVLLMSRNPHLRKAGIVDFEGICSDVSYIIRTKDESVIMQRFIPILFQSDCFWEFAEKNKKGSTNFFLNWSDFEKFEFYLPDISVQKKICESVWTLYETVESYEKMIALSDDIIKARFVEMFGNIGTDPYKYGLKKLRECVEINPKKPRDIDDNLEVSFVPMTAVTEKGEIDASITKEYMNVKKGFTYFEEEDVLFAKITPCMENGKGCIAQNLSNGIGMGSTEFHVLRPISDVSNPYWIYVLTILNDFRVLARNKMTGTGGQLRVPVTFLENFMVALPPIEKQDEFELFVRDVIDSKNQITLMMENVKCIYSKIINKNISNKEG